MNVELLTLKSDLGICRLLPYLPYEMAGGVEPNFEFVWGNCNTHSSVFLRGTYVAVDSSRVLFFLFLFFFVFFNYYEIIISWNDEKGLD